MKDNDKSMDQNDAGFELHEVEKANTDSENEVEDELIRYMKRYPDEIVEITEDEFYSDDDDFDFRLDDDDDQDIDLDWGDDYEEEEEILGPPKPNIPKKRLIEGLTLEWADFENRTFSSFQLSHFSLYNVTFKNCTLDNIDCWDGRFIACKFENCEILSFSGERYAFRECEFIECRFGGIDYVDDEYHISNCKHINCTTDYDE
ncbi:hypothetical protein [Ruminococcus flavefaciens]|uniref:hypothetical protein n=1 Tax=Ruminococcus flavefaciens TaxID=1265 RepID=UPI0026E9A3D9|nr:hypothetical protein [Ruminococcus flavefaciens]